MPFPFDLPTTGSISLSHHITSKSHPSLLLTATSKRAVLKDVLKRHKRLSSSDRPSHLARVEDAVLGYLPYLLLLSSPQEQRNHGVDIQATRSFQVEWRSTLSTTLPGREPSRLKIASLEHEVRFVLLTLAYVKTLLARSQLKILHDSSVLTTEQRATSFITASKHMLDAHSILCHLAALPVTAASNGPVETLPPTSAGMASLALAEANLVFVAKDDPYAAAVADERNDKNTDWMYKAPSIPKVRASLYARICIAASEHAAQAHAAFASTGKINEALLRYANDLRQTARAKAIRLLAANSEASGNTGEALAWLNAAKKELGLTSDAEAGKRKGLRGLKQSWQERREDRKVEKGSVWGLDAGRLEEARIIETLDAKWDKENSTINVQLVPPFEPLLQRLPSGRDPHTAQPWIAPSLTDMDLSMLRAPVDPSQLYQAEEEDSGAEDLYTTMPQLSVGGFPDVESEKKSAAGAYY